MYEILIIVITVIVCSFVAVKYPNSMFCVVDSTTKIGKLCMGLLKKLFRHNKATDKTVEK